MNLIEINNSLTIYGADYISYVDKIDSVYKIDLLKELPSAYILYLKSRENYLQGNLSKAKIYYQLNHILHSSSIPFEAVIGKNSVFAYGGIGCIIHGNTKIGARCTIGSNVTIGGSQSGVPVIGEDVYISTGAKILGGITIGDGAVIGANAVVTKDVDSFNIIAGIPGRVINKITVSNFNKYSGYYWCKNSNDSAKRFCDWYQKKGKLVNE